MERSSAVGQGRQRGAGRGQRGANQTSLFPGIQLFPLLFAQRVPPPPHPILLFGEWEFLSFYLLHCPTPPTFLPLCLLLLSFLGHSEGAGSPHSLREQTAGGGALKGMWLDFLAFFQMEPKDSKRPS